MGTNSYEPPDEAKEVGTTLPGADYFLIWLRILTVPAPVALLVTYLWFWMDALNVEEQSVLVIRGVYWRYAELAVAVSFGYCAVSVVFWFFLPIVREARKQS